MTTEIISLSINRMRNQDGHWVYTDEAVGRKDDLVRVTTTYAPAGTAAAVCGTSSFVR